MNIFSHMIDFLLNQFFYKDSPGEVSWYPEEDHSRQNIDGHLIIRTAPGVIDELSYGIANRYLARRQNGAVLMRVMSTAILEGMNPIGFRIGKRLFSPYSAQPMREEELWPQLNANAQSRSVGSRSVGRAFGAV